MMDRINLIRGARGPAVRTAHGSSVSPINVLVHPECPTGAS